MDWSQTVMVTKDNVHRELEQEFKNTLTQTDYHKLLAHFKTDKGRMLQLTNAYFDQDDHLKNHGMALRIRVINQGRAEMTLKYAIGPLQKAETTVALSVDEAYSWIDSGRLTVAKPIGDALLEQQITTTTFPLVTAMTTKRYELPYQTGLLVLDQVTFSDKTIDFELEYEVTDLAIGQKEFSALLHQFNIPRIVSAPKIERALAHESKR